ncbi:hypothetical protein Cni_G05938 [Canna indica]|uniref:RING-type E3 ubiquitin transferase n=1 Tax=Canna indica TaxID=4628 RepID=A0AAQ3Q3M5_9LILI|nr:hypothetical protein Cni_G05938 [Canna indica]
MASPSFTFAPLQLSSTHRFLFLLLALCASFSPISAVNSQYDDHCGNVVRSESEATRVFIDQQHSFHISKGYFSGGGGLFSYADDSTVFSPPSFEFRTKSVHKTRSPRVLKIEGTLLLYGAFRNWTQYNRRFHWSPHTLVEEATFELSGYWSESTGMLCMVGDGIFEKAKGKPVPLSAVLKLNYQNTSSLLTSLVNGTVESLDDGSNPFDPISLLAYAQKNYEFTSIPKARSSCSSFKLEEEFVEMGPASACKFFYHRKFRIDYKNTDCTGSNCRTLGTSLGFTQKFLSLDMVQCSENGIRMHIEFTNSSIYAYNMPVKPDKSLVGEGYWDPHRNQFCIIACMLNKSSQNNFSVGDCTFGLSLWFPTVVTLRNRGDMVGNIWSNKKKNDEGYFDMVSIHSLSTRSLSHGLYYKYTEIDSVKKFCNTNSRGKLGDIRYPRAKSSAGITFRIRARDRGKQGRGDATMLSVGDKYYGATNWLSDRKRSAAKIAAMESFAPATNYIIWNVSYSISIRYFQSFPRDDEEEDGQTVFAAEGLYNDRTGTLCMKGCRYPPSTKKHGAVLDFDSLDCEIRIDIQLPPLNPEVEMHINGTIRSMRDKLDPIYFDTINFTSSHMYSSQAAESIRRMDVENIMVLISLTFSCICTAMQIFHSKKHRNILPSMSITMLVVFVLGYMIPLVLNSEAMFMRERQGFVLLQNGRWLETNEVIIRMISMIGFFLSLRLIQLAFSSRSTEQGKDFWVKEKTTLKVCLPLCGAGGLLTWLVCSQWQALISYFGLILDGFLLPQIILNICTNSREKVLGPFFYVGITVTRALPHVYDAYRASGHTPHVDSTYIYGNPERDFYSMAWDVIIPCQGFLLALLVYLQQRFGGGFFLPWIFSKFGGYQAVPRSELNA